jgi:hypothetical protein
VVRATTVATTTPVPKFLGRFMGVRTTTLAGGSRFTGILSILGRGTGTAASGTNILRIAGRLAVPVAAASLVIDAASLGICTFIDQ